MPIQERPAPALDRPKPSNAIVKRLETMRADMHTFRRRRLWLTTVLVVLIGAGLLAAADWLLVLDTTLRAVGLIAIGGIGAVWFARGVLRNRSFGRPDAAVEVETSFPQLGQRVRTTLEYSEALVAPMPAAPGLVNALATDTDHRTHDLDFKDLIPWRWLRFWKAVLVGVAALFAALLVINEEIRTAALRFFLIPVHYTQLHVTPGDRAVKAGSDLIVEATLGGRPASSAGLYHRKAGADDWTKLALAGDVESKQFLGTFATALKNCQEDLEYRVVAGSVESPVYRVTVLHPLALKHIEAVVEPPAYTRKPTATIKEGNLKVIAGSRVRWHITLDRPPQSAHLVVRSAGSRDKQGGKAVLRLQTSGAELIGELPAVSEKLEYEIVARSADGMRLEADRFRIDVTPDHKPTIRFLKPREQIEVTPTTEVRMRILAEDDFGLSKTGIVYQVGSGLKKTLYLQQDPKQPTTLGAEAVLPLEDEQLTFQDGVTYYAFAEDNHPDQPQRATTELQFIDIRPYKRAYQLLDTGGS